jgi:guanylate kinase
MKKDKIIIVGKGGSGKDFIRNYFERRFPNTKYCKSYTTRPIREGEENGKDYIFINDSEIPSEKDLYESVYFNGWFYGTLKKDFNESNLFIMTPKGISSLKKKDRKKCLVLYIKADEEIRRERLSRRKDADDVERRIKADEEDFSKFDDYDIAIGNSEDYLDISPEQLMEYLNQNMPGEIPGIS